MVGLVSLTPEHLGGIVHRLVFGQKALTFKLLQDLGCDPSLLSEI